MSTQLGMELKKTIENLKVRFEKYKNKYPSEAQTEAWFIDPFLRSLGYERDNPDLVDVQFLAVPGDQKTGKVDYALLKDKEPIIFMEAKKLHESLDSHWHQISRYFNQVRKVDFAILTNGSEYRFYTDLVAVNMLDKEPFLEFDLHEVDEELENYLVQFSSHNYDSRKLKDLAQSLSDSDKIFSFLKEQFRSPSDEFVHSMSSLVFGTARRATRDKVRKALPDVFSKLVAAADPPDTGPVQKPKPPEEEQNIFEVGDMKHQKLDCYRFENETLRGNFTDMLVYVFSSLSNKDSFKLMSAFPGPKGFIVANDRNLIRRSPRSIGNGLFISSNYANNDKVKYIQTALKAFGMEDSLWVKLGRQPANTEEKTILGIPPSHSDHS